MPDSLKKTGRQDDERINISQQYEVNYWAKEFHVTPERLREVVRQAGPLVKDVKRKLGQ